MNERPSTHETRSYAAAGRLLRYFLSTHKPTERVVRFGNSDKPTAAIAGLEQSLPEHVYGMSVLADYILDTDPTTAHLDRIRIQRMIRSHDLHEGITGDHIRKTDASRAQEEATDALLIEQARAVGDHGTADAIVEYRAHTTPEALFVKGVDRLEAYLTLINSGNSDKFANRSDDVAHIALELRTVSPLLADAFTLVVRFLRRDRGKQFEFDFDAP